MEKLEQFKKKIAALDSLVLKEDLEKFLKFIVDFTAALKKSNTETIQNLKETFAGFMAEMKTDCQGDMEKGKEMMMNYCEKEMAYMEKEHKEMMEKMERKMAEIHSGKDADEYRVAENASKMAYSEVLKQIPTIDTIEADMPKLGGSIASALELLPEGDKLKLEAIQGLKAELDELRKLRTQRLGGGGFSKIAMDFHIIDAETPTGTINSVNKDFTLTNIPNPTASLKVFVNGQRMKLTDDYTLSSKTITLNTAPPTDSLILCDYQI